MICLRATFGEFWEEKKGNNENNNDTDDGDGDDDVDNGTNATETHDSTLFFLHQNKNT